MLYGLGLRISELSDLKLEDIKEKWVQIHGKGSKVRELPLLEVITETYCTLHKTKQYLKNTFLKKVIHL